MINFLNIYATQILTIHIVCGGISLLLPTINVVYILIANPRHERFLTRARITHRVIWSLFHSSMMLVGITGIALSFITIPVSYFLFSVALFTIYMVTAASRALLGRALQSSDAVLGGVMVVIGAAMVVYGLYGLIIGTLSVSVAPLIVFGGIGGAFGMFDCRAIRRARLTAGTTPTTFHARFFSRNFGALTATLTAFLVVNVESASVIVRVMVWIAPTALMTPLIAYFTRLYYVGVGISTDKSRGSDGGNMRLGGVSRRLQQHIHAGFPPTPVVTD